MFLQYYYKSLFLNNECQLYEEMLPGFPVNMHLTSNQLPSKFAFVSRSKSESASWFFPRELDIDTIVHPRE